VTSTLHPNHTKHDSFWILLATLKVKCWNKVCVCVFITYVIAHLGHSLLGEKNQVYLEKIQHLLLHFAEDNQFSLDLNEKKKYF